MKKSSLKLLLVFAVILLVSNFVSSTVYYSEMKAIYNLGERLDVDVLVEPIDPDLLVKVNLYCNDRNVLEFNDFPDENGIVSIKIPLNYYTLKESNGNCNFVTNYYEDIEIKSPFFEISKVLDVYPENTKIVGNPGDSISISGNVYRLNGDPANGEVEISLPQLRTIIINEPTEEVIEESVESNETVVENNETIETETNETVVENNETIETETNETEEIVEETEDVVEEEVVEEVVDSETTSTEVLEDIYYTQVIDGYFEITLPLKEDMPAGNYRIDIYAYEKVKDKIASEGIGRSDLEVFQVLTNVDMALNQYDIEPGNEIEIKPILLDQSGIDMSGEVKVSIINEFDEIIFENLGNSGDIMKYLVPTNLSSGYYDIIVSSDALSKTDSFFVREKAAAEFEIINDILVVRNTGNIPYNKSLRVTFNGENILQEIEIDTGVIKEYQLKAKEGSYSVSVSDGDREISLDGVALTGNAISIKDLDSRIDFTSVSTYLWILAIIIILIVIIYLFKRLIKSKSVAYHIKKFKIRRKKSDIVEVGKGKIVKPVHNDVKLSKSSSKKSSILNPPTRAEQVLVSKGSKDDATVVVLKIKNKLTDNSKSSLEGLIKKTYDKKGAIYEHGENIYIIFTSLITRKKKNIVIAANVAQDIIRMLKDHNAKFQDKIDFGISITSGTINNAIEDDKLKFTALGNFMMKGKRLAEASHEEILIEAKTFEKNKVELKGDEVKLDNDDAYILRMIVDKERNDKFLKSFLSRQKK